MGLSIENFPKDNLRSEVFRLTEVLSNNPIEAVHATY